MRRRRSWVWAVLLLVGFVAAVGGVLGLLMKQDPEFYTRAAVADRRPDDLRTASDTQTTLDELRTKVFATPEWGATLSADHLNAFFREDPALNNLVEPRLGGLTAPRVAVDGDRLKLAARYGCGFWSTVVSVELRAWVIADEPNLFAVELVSHKAGALPLPTRWLMDALTAFVADKGIGVTWYRSAARPVAVCKWLPGQSRPNTLLQTIAFEDGAITVGGRNLSIR